MKENNLVAVLRRRYVSENDHKASDYFGLIRELLRLKSTEPQVQQAIAEVYELIRDEIETTRGKPRNEITFGTSGWRGILGKDVYRASVAAVTEGIVDLYRLADDNQALHELLGVSSLDEARTRGCLVGWDNRFGGEIFGGCVADTLTRYGFNVYMCGESTTGVLSAALLELRAAFSINLTPSHNPLDYSGFKYNAADGGPAASELTAIITENARKRVAMTAQQAAPESESTGKQIQTDSLALWQQKVERSASIHRIDYRELLHRLADHDDIVVVIDSVHGASRIHLERLLGPAARRLELLRGEADPTFGGIAPEPSSENMSQVTDRLRASDKKLKIGAIIDPDADRIRFTDGETEISMNQFGAMAYDFLHEHRNLRGMVAKTVATSNEFKPVIGTALVCFEESDGISIIGHTPEKDAYIGLLLALDMVIDSGTNLGDIKREMDKRYGAFYPDRDGIEVSLKGDALLEALAGLEKYRVGAAVRVGSEEKRIKEVISIDGRKMIFADDSWLMIRPSGTEPKVRFYVESRDPDGTEDLVTAAREMLAEIGLLN
ncbi:MAG: phosphoglucomutase [Desulfofustis sp.]